MKDVLTWALFMGAMTGFWMFVFGAAQMIREAAELVDDWATNRMLGRIAIAIVFHEASMGRSRRDSLSLASKVLDREVVIR